MKKILFPVIILCLFLYARPKSEGNPVPVITKETKAAIVASSKLKVAACGPSFTIYNNYSHVYRLVIKLDGVTYLDETNPTFPYFVPGSLPNGTYSIAVSFKPFPTIPYSGALRVTNSSGLYACAPINSWAPAVTFTPGCDLYDITITGIPGCGI